MTFEDFMKDFHISKSLTSTGECILNIVNIRLNMTVEAVWFRMDTSNNFHDKIFRNHLVLRQANYTEFVKYLTQEIRTAKQVLFNGNQIRLLSNYDTVNINKFMVLQKAAEFGLTIPDSLFANNKYDVMEFVRNTKIETLICKSIALNLSTQIEKGSFIYQPITEIPIGEIRSLPELFLPALFQKKIEKEFEVRVFYLDGHSYAMSIHSNSLDYRENYETCRYNTIKLPLALEAMIRKLMKSLNLNTGSLDLIKGKENGIYYFLEINPNGQFGMVSEPCNYYLEKKVAEFLCHEKRRKKSVTGYS